ncbi:unnamed protein product [Phytomonas sp. EM1]|nr:unnamed protein product [Phytomonas sp. EM1]|eukprot:CCW61126.1 unnamed protein product [Phytomonas sp. isolate EM1]
MVRITEWELSAINSPVIPQKNFIVTFTLAIGVLGLTAAVYIANWRRAPSFITQGNKASINSSAPADTSGRAGTGDNQGASAAVRAQRATSSASNILSKCYFTLQAERHVKRNNTNLVEWQDDALGISIPFSPILFTVKHEGRQAPMVLLTLCYLRQEGHRVTITIEETFNAETAENYRKMSLLKIADCSKILSTSITRIGNNQYPQAEYCYLNEENQLVYVLSVFLTHERLALTLQYSADTRVRGILPTAFNELVRAVRFSQPRPSSSYLLVSEPRLGLGFRLPLDFRVYEGLPEDIDETFYYYRQHANCGSANMPTCRVLDSAPRYGNETRVTSDFPKDAHLLYQQRHFGDSGDTSFFSPFATAVGRGMRCMGIIASYEPSITAFGSSSDSADGSFTRQHYAFYSSNLRTAENTTIESSSAFDGKANIISSASWHTSLERQLKITFMRFGIHIEEPMRVIFRDEVNVRNGQEESISAGCIIIRPYRLLLLKQGNFSNLEDEEDAARNTLLLLGSCCLQEVRLNPDSPCLGLINDKTYWEKAVLGDVEIAPAARLRAYFGAFYIPIGNECVSFYFFASVNHHSFEDFASFCAATMQSMSLGNHNGQTTSLSYCNMRHVLQPFSLILRPGSDVEEPQLGDPLALVHVGDAALISPVILRMFPLQEPAASGHVHASSVAQVSQMPSPKPFETIGNDLNKHLIPLPPPYFCKTAKPRAQHRLLEYAVHWHLSQMYMKEDGDGVRILQWEPLTLNSMPALLVCFEPKHDNEDIINELMSTSGPSNREGGVGSNTRKHALEGLANSATLSKDDIDTCSEAASEWMVSRALSLEEDVGSFNPFSQYYPPPVPPPPAYFGLRLLSHGNSEVTLDKKSQVKHTESIQASQYGTSKARSGTFQEDTSCSNNKSHEAQPTMMEYIYASGFRSNSVRSQCGDLSAEENTLRVALVLYVEGNAFLCMTSASRHSLKSVQQSVQELASNFVLLHSL